jgi:hypothetical protein
MKSSTRLIRQNKELKDRQRMKDLRISYVGLLPLEQWPKHLFITFQQIRRIRSYDLLTFCNNALAKSKHEITWDYETTNRAKTIAATCRTLLRDEVSEMEWRLRLEELVLARFRSEIEW